MKEEVELLTRDFLVGRVIIAALQEEGQDLGEEK